MRKAVEPQGEARDDFAIFRAIAARLGVEQAYTDGLDEAGWLRRLYDETIPRAAAVGIELPSFDAFWEQGIVNLSAHRKPTVMLEAFRNDPDKHRLGTPSGRIEIFSERIDSFGLPDCPGHPVWREPFEWLGSPATATYPLHLLSDQPQRRLHSQLDPSPHSRAGKVAEREPVYLNRADAAARGIAEGDIVELFNDRGRCLAGAILSEAIMPGVARLATGAWFDPWEGGDRHGNPNILTLDRGASGFSQGCSAQSCLVEARKYQGNAPPVEAFTLPRIVNGS